MTATPDDTPNLDDWLGENPETRTGVVPFVDTLPSEIRDQLHQSDASTQRLVKWLRAIGYSEATYAKLDRWRRSHRDQ